jgi:enamine deaminase RidA (YjgF/YER057c/UK114 family)
MIYEHVRDAGPFVFVAGQTPQRDSGEVPDEIGAQAVVALGKIAALLAERDLGLIDVVKVTYFLTDMGELEQFGTRLMRPCLSSGRRRRWWRCPP